MSPTFPLLGLVLRGATYGYELKQIVRTEFEPYWRLDFAQLYRSLAKLDRAGLVRARVVAGEGGPDRKRYSVTPEGRAAFGRWIRLAADSHDEYWVKLRLALTLGFDPEPLVQGEQARLARDPDLLPGSALAETDPIGWLWAQSVQAATDAQRDALRYAASLVGGSGAAGEDSGAPLVLAGSDDPLLKRLCTTVGAVSRVTGSTAGLLTLAQHRADLAGAHLHDPESDEYNVPFVRHLLPEQDILLVNLAVREYGLMVAPENPKRIRAVRDLGRRGVRLINRSRGAGARLWLQQLLHASGIDPVRLRDWERAAPTYDLVAGAISAGAADVGPGLRSVAVKWGLEFILLGAEHFDLVVPRTLYASARGRRLLEILHGKELRAYGRTLPGYDLAESGRVRTRIKYGTRVS